MDKRPTIAVQVPPEVLGEVALEAVRAALFGFLGMAALATRSGGGPPLTPRERAECAVLAFRSVLDKIPAANPFREAFERYARDYLAPAILESREPTPPTLRIVP